MNTRDTIDRFLELFQVPPAIHSYVAVFAEPDEIRLITVMNGQTLSPEQVANLMGWTAPEARDFLERAYRRHFVHREVDGKKVGYIFDHQDTRGRVVRYMPARFYDRLDELAMYGPWDDIPEHIRKEISQWWLTDYVTKIAPVVAQIKQDPDACHQIKQKDFLLLPEALAQVEAARVHAILNCDCRTSTRGCHRMMESCIRLDDGARYTLERGLGRALTREECIAAVLKTDREGLMHIGTRHQADRPLFGFCNCCTCCCFPLRASALLDSDRTYPRVHHAAVRHAEACTHCGTCVRRCPYQAFFHDGIQWTSPKGKIRKAVAFDPARCYGCGLCRTACPAECIEMIPLRPNDDDAP